jgi:hypothetical protein
MQRFTGREYLKIDIASNFGLSKENWNDRIAWFDQNESSLHSLINKAENPALFFAGVLAWEDVEAGNPIGYMISLDATSSGLQILAALTGDRPAAEICNVVDTGHREDAYSAIYFEMLRKTGGQAKINRDDCKQAIMTSLYGSKAMPKTVFGTGELLTVFYDTMEENAPAAWDLNEAMLTAWNPNAFSHDWVMPDNFHVHTKVMDTEYTKVNFFDEPFEVTYNVNRPTPTGRSLGANMVHSIDGMIVRELGRRCNYDPILVAQVRKIAELALHGVALHQTMTNDDKTVVTLWNHYQKTGYLSARILDHLKFENFGHVDPTEVIKLIDSLPERPFKVVSVHDCFRCLPHYGNDLREQYNLQLALIASSDLLQEILSQIIGKPVIIGKLDATLAADIINTNYALS